MTIDKYPIEKLIGEEVLRAVSLAEAYDVAGLGDHIEGLERRRLADSNVYQVTPKGNTLLDLQKDSGDPSPKRELKKSLVTVPGLLAHS